MTADTRPAPPCYRCGESFAPWGPRLICKRCFDARPPRLNARATWWEGAHAARVRAARLEAERAARKRRPSARILPFPRRNARDR